MKRRHFLGTVAAGALGGTLVHGQTATSAPTPAAGPLVRTPLVLMAPRPDGFEAVWAVNRLSTGRLEWKTAEGGAGEVSADAFGFVPQGKNVLRVRVDGLKPATPYQVRSITTAADDGEQVVSEWKAFRTLNPAGPSTTFVVWNDTHLNNPSIQKLHELTPAADFLVWNGDTCNDWKSEDLLIPTLLYPGERDITVGRPLFITWGNHDVRGPHGYQMPGIVATPGGRPFYAFRSGPVAAICLHTGEDKPDSHPSFRGRVAFEALRREQARWLAETIRRPEMRDAPYRVVFCHIPLRWVDESVQDYANKGFDRHSGRSRDAWHDVLVAWKVQLIISGHTHQTTWMPPTDRFPYGQLIGGGPQLHAATWMEGRADKSALEIKVRDLTGNVRHSVRVTPLT